MRREWLRSSLNAYDQISNKLEIPVIALHRTDETYYHLDTGMSILYETAVLVEFVA